MFLPWAVRQASPPIRPSWTPTELHPPTSVNHQRHRQDGKLVADLPLAAQIPALARARQTVLQHLHEPVPGQAKMAAGSVQALVEGPGALRPQVPTADKDGFDVAGVEQARQAGPMADSRKYG